MTNSLYTKLLQAEIVCRDCGMKYGKYSVGCSSTWEGDCDVCGERKGVTEVRDWGYLTKGIREMGAGGARPFSELTKDFTPERKERIKMQSKQVAAYMASVGPIMDDDELDGVMMASYEFGEITLKLTEAEVAALSELAEDHCDNYPGSAFESLWEKIEDLYQDYCVKYELAPAMKAYYAKFASYGNDDEEDRVRWATFRDAFNAGLEYSKEVQ
jgi:hypothetical protein